MAKDPETDGEDELAALVMPRDPKLPPTQLLEAPEDDGKPQTGVGEWPEAPEGLDFSDDTVPAAGGVPDEGNTLDEPMPTDMLGPLGDELAHEWDDDVQTVVDDPSSGEPE